MIDGVPPVHLVALGSSYAAGPGLLPVVEKAAMRSGANYAHQLADRLGGRLTDLTVSGATTATIASQAQRTLRGKTFPPQVNGVPADADLVTVTAGGNDMNYIGTLLRLAIAGRLHGRLRAWPVGAVLAGPSVPVVAPAAVDAPVTGLVRVVQDVRARAPRARILLVDYLAVIGPDTAPGRSVPLTTEQLAALRGIKAQLDAAFETAAEQSGAELVRVSALSVDHALGAPDPWVFGLEPLHRLPASFHPNAAGMQAVAAEIHRHLALD
ncbi:SGNH/GDSL hydrolase family protein [Modestobacter excelsi]|uniref:SGNH/GDSL hydrolase family protein n=1 Tax=Modestobacter excelsi TaxID=2213161 RepID=UPI001C20E7B9|nr:SGNH/GDSL hydrolase family protein [Modestobacter excelsi]